MMWICISKRERERERYSPIWKYIIIIDNSFFFFFNFLMFIIYIASIYKLSKKLKNITIRGCLVLYFKHHISIFKQYYTFFHIFSSICISKKYKYLNNITHFFTFFHPYVFSKNTNNINNITKRILAFYILFLSIQSTHSSFNYILLWTPKHSINIH